jgi:nitroimidazol reductase NimA-like FMN-containing flavoprotein (pyridoxamine 5'-phosphate oxidase superfamily)
MPRRIASTHSPRSVRRSSGCGDNPKVCLEVEEIDDRNSWTTVLVLGRYEEIHQSSGESEARERAEQLFAARPGWWLPAAAKVLGHERPDVVVCRIQIDRLTGRRTARRD